MADGFIRRKLLAALYADLYLVEPTAAAHGLTFWMLAHLWAPDMLADHW